MRTRHVLAPVVSLVLALSLGLPAAPAAALTSAQLPSRWVGLYVPGSPLDISRLSTVETQIGTPASVENYFQDISGGFTAVQAGNAGSHGAIPLVTLEFWNGAYGVSQPQYSLRRIAGGALDSYLHSFARSAKAFGREVWLRPFHEMNGNWYPWGGTVNGNSPSDFVPAWRRVRAIFTAEGATNVKFVWCPNAESVPNTYSNAIARYWPGDAYVDRIALDGYNFGGSTSSWRSFSSVFANSYASVTALSATKPIFIAETACGTVGGDKAAWISDMFAAVPARFPRISGITWFDTVKERDWRIDSSSATLSAYRAGLLTWGLMPSAILPAGATSSISIRTSAVSAAVGSSPVLTGSVGPAATSGLTMEVYVLKPGRTVWSYASRRGIAPVGGVPTWRYGYLFTSAMAKGTYRFRAIFPGGGGLSASASPSIASITLR